MGNAQAAEQAAAGPSGTVVAFFTGSLVPGLPKEVFVTLERPVSLDELIATVEQMVGVPELRSRLERYCAILVNGTSIQHLQGWATPVCRGARVSVVIPMGGGSQG